MKNRAPRLQTSWKIMKNEVREATGRQLVPKVQNVNLGVILGAIFDQNPYFSASVFSLNFGMQLQEFLTLIRVISLQKEKKILI